MCFHVISPFFSVFNSNYTLPHSYVNLIIEHSYKIFQNIFSLIYLSITSIQILAVRTSIFCVPDFQFLAIRISNSLQCGFPVSGVPEAKYLTGFPLLRFTKFFTYITEGRLFPCRYRSIKPIPCTLSIQPFFLDRLIRSSRIP